MAAVPTNTGAATYVTNTCPRVLSVVSKCHGKGSLPAVAGSGRLLPMATAASSLACMVRSRGRRMTRQSAGHEKWTKAGLQKMGRADLMELCQTHGLKDTSRCKKHELIEYLLEQSADPQSVKQSFDSAELSSLALSTHGWKTVETTLRAAFATAKSDGKALKLPSTFGARERKLAHLVAEELGLNHESHGEGVDRRVWIWSTRASV
eukprot:TRINITY_DN13605_c0_g1_i1.p1 TRINITY_DN13605_c0_g1~~TRINITY_DN13605_c0_g1_i1.p1  ORF type:complete len:207 (+),score=30.37 TRINITY_DN13605_c0_g1_i1:191-811(+)